MTANALTFTVQEPSPPVQEPPDYAKYPMVMVHPHARKAETHGIPGTEKRDSVTGEIIPGQFWSYGGSSDFMPPVTVNNSEQEAFHHAQGYRPGGTGDIAAFSNLTAGATIKPHVVEEYPKWVGDVLVNSAEEEAALAPVAVKAPPRHTPTPKKATEHPAIGPRRRKTPSARSEAMKASWAARKAAQA